jgi:hypothetical protein
MGHFICVQIRGGMSPADAAHMTHGPGSDMAGRTIHPPSVQRTSSPAAGIAQDRTSVHLWSPLPWAG